MDRKDWWTIYTNAQKALTTIPGVVGVGLGIKEVKGQLSEQVALIVYVQQKLAKGRISPDQMIPSAFQGMATDVQRHQQAEPFGGTTLQGGMQIRRLPDAQDHPKFGTLAYIATRISDSQNVMLSCEHVMLFHREDERSIFHPDVSRCCGKLKHKVGNVVAGKMANVSFDNGSGAADYAVDAALATIDSGIDAQKYIPNVGNIIGSGDISASPTGSGNPIISVKKVGAASAFTQGTVDDVAFPQGPAQRLIKIRPTTTGGFPFTIRWKVPPADVAQHLTDYPAASLGGTATQVASDEIEFHVSTFCLPGDSGAAVVDGTGKIVGVIVSGGVYPLDAYKGTRLGTGIVPTGFGIACHIGPILQELGIRIDPSTAPSTGNLIVTPGEDVFRGADVVRQIHARLSNLEKELDRLPQGRRLIELVRAHAEEVMDLVHHRRKVMVAWHRSEGPAFSNLYLKSLMEPDRDLPREVKDTTLHAARERMYRVLMEEGSSSLQNALKTNKELICGLVDHSRSINELVEKTSKLTRETDLAGERK